MRSVRPRTRKLIRVLRHAKNKYMQGLPTHQRWGAIDASKQKGSWYRHSVAGMHKTARKSIGSKAWRHKLRQKHGGLYGNPVKR